MAKMTGAQALVASLGAEGVEVVFGIPGRHALPIYNVLRDQQTIRSIVTRHEQGAAFMADGYARVTGKPGVCIATTGPGATNTITSIAGAYADSSPLLVITTQIPSSFIGKAKGVDHELKDQLALFEGITKWNKRINYVEDIPRHVHEALRQISIGRPGPVLLEIPVDILEIVGDVEILAAERYERKRGDVRRIAEAVRCLIKAKAPVIWAGGGAVSSGATEELVHLSEILQAPVVTTTMGKGAVPNDHLLSIGSLSSEAAIQAFLDQCDVMLAVGTRFKGRATRDWSLRLPQQLIHIDIDQSEIGKNYSAGIGIVGDAGETLREILQCVRSNLREPRRSRVREVKALKEQIYRELETWAANELQILDDIRESLDRDAIVVNDIALCTNWARRYFEVYEPRTFLFPDGFGSLGFSLPAGIGAKIAYPNRQVVVLCGDGGFMFSCQELATAVRYGANIAVMVFNDNCFGAIKYLQDKWFGGRHTGINLINPDFVEFAKSFGAGAFRVGSLQDLRPTLDRALRLEKPVIIEVPVELQHP